MDNEYRESECTQYNEDGSLQKDEDGNPILKPCSGSYIALIRFDVNGNKQPNQFGRDAYWLWIYKNKVAPGTDNHVGGKSFKNILTGKDKLEYENYSKGKVLNFKTYRDCLTPVSMV